MGVTQYDNYSVWFSRGDDGRVAVAVTTIEKDGQVALLHAEEFGPFDTDQDIVDWLWARLSLATGRSVR